jgi:hypothetical protein
MLLHVPSASTKVPVFLLSESLLGSPKARLVSGRSLGLGALERSTARDSPGAPFQTQSGRHLAAPQQKFLCRALKPSTLPQTVRLQPLCE